jgi:hypothetical protein
MPTKMSLSSAFFRWCSDGNERRRQYANDRYFVAMNDRHATKFPTTHTQQNFRRQTRNKIPLADERPWRRRMLSALFLLRLEFVERRRGATKRAQADKHLLLEVLEAALYDPEQ